MNMTSAPTARAPLMRKARDPVASGVQTRRRSALTACAHTEAPVLTLKSNVPANCVAAESQARREPRPDSTSCIQAAVEKNHEPMNVSALATPAPITAGSPGRVAIAKHAEPTANSQHCRTTVAIAVIGYSRARIRSPTSAVENFPAPRVARWSATAASTRAAAASSPM